MAERQLPKLHTRVRFPSPAPIRTLRIVLAVALVLVAGLMVAPGNAVAGGPPDELLDAIFPVLRGKKPASPPLQNAFLPRPSGPADPVCGLTKIDLVQTKGDQKRLFHLLADPALGNDNQPKTVLIRLNTLGVDVDGSHRAYHPDDPYGNHCKSPADDPATQVCAVNSLGNAEIRVFEHNRRVAQYAGKSSGPNPAFAAAWSSLWTEIAARRDQWVDLQAYFGARTPRDTRLYYSSELDRAVTFNTEIIPFKDGFPCQHGDKQGEYFIAATTRRDPPPPASVSDACRTAEHLDAMTIPYVVLPPAFSAIKVGDIAIGIASIEGVERLAFGVYGDQGPSRQIGEASVAFVQKLRGTSNIIKNNSEAVALQIETGHRPGQAAMLGILVLGGTAAMLGADYSVENVERVARAAFARWTAQHGERLRACMSSARSNPLKGSRN
jgi:hypothetical protein